jgi:NAD(P)-dependent dehydrogenase (short-subunit alcohol dehydrogenase family)
MAKCKDWNVVVTGASSGIGRAAAIAFGHQGASVWLGARDVHELETTAKFAMAEGGTAHVHALDVTRPASVRAFGEWVEKEAGCVDVLVNNAGVGAWGTVDDLTEETWRRAIDTNLTGPFLVTKALLPAMRKREGRRHILNVVSVAGRQAFPGNGAYAASKFGLRGWTEALALELAPEGIRVTNVSPGYVATDLTKRADDAEKMVQPDDLARLMVDLTLAPDSLFQDEVVVWPWRQYTE